MLRKSDKEQDYQYWREVVIAPLRSRFDTTTDISLQLGITPFGKLHEVDVEYFPTFSDSGSLGICTFEKTVAKELLSFSKNLWKRSSLNVGVQVGWTWGDYPLTTDSEVLVHMARPWYAVHLNRLPEGEKAEPFPSKELDFLCMSHDPRAAVPGSDWLKFRSCKVSPVTCEETPEGLIFEVHTERDTQNVSAAYSAYDGLPACEIAVTKNRSRDAALPYRVAVTFPG
jgi:hypothetical protein